MKLSNKKPIVLFDIDYTMFDVKHFDINFHKYIAKLLDLDERSVQDSALKIMLDLIEKEHFLDIDKYLKTILLEFKKEKYLIKVEKFLFAKDFFKKGFYPDVGVTIRILKDMVRLGIFSQGDERLQGAKISQSGLRHFFEKELVYLIKPKKLDFLPSLMTIHKEDKVYLIEDKLDVLHEVKKQMPSVFGIWIKRGWYAKNQKNIAGFIPDAEITDLKEVVEIIKKN